MKTYIVSEYINEKFNSIGQFAHDFNVNYMTARNWSVKNFTMIELEDDRIKIIFRRGERIVQREYFTTIDQEEFDKLESLKIRDRGSLSKSKKRPRKGDRKDIIRRIKNPSCVLRWENQIIPFHKVNV